MKKTDGTLDGTSIVEEIPASFYDIFGDLFEIDGRLGFEAKYRQTFIGGVTERLGFAFYNPDTKFLLHRDDSLSLSEELGSNDSLEFFRADDDLYIVEGGQTQLELLGSFNHLHEGAMVINQRLLFMADNGTHGSEFWISDGTITGTNMVKDLIPGAESSTPAQFIKAGNKVFFAANDILYLTDGTSNGTIEITEVNNRAFSNVKDLNVINDILFFTASVEGVGHQIVRTNGTNNGTGIVTRAIIQKNGYSPESMSPLFKGFRYWVDGDEGSYSIWKSNLDTTIKVANQFFEDLSSFDFKYP